MRCFGEKQIFAIEYEIFDNADECLSLRNEDGHLNLWVDNKELCCFNSGGKMYKYSGNLSYIVDWFTENEKNIINEIEFPLPVQADTSIEFWNKCRDFDSDDDDEFDSWIDKGHGWYFRHSWLVVNHGCSYLPDVMFRRVNDKIEVEWDNTNIYDGVIEFVNPKGIYYVDINLFQQVIHDFTEDFIKQGYMRK